MIVLLLFLKKNEEEKSRRQATFIMKIFPACKEFYFLTVSGHFQLTLALQTPYPFRRPSPRTTPLNATKISLLTSPSESGWLFNANRQSSWQNSSLKPSLFVIFMYLSPIKNVTVELASPGNTFSKSLSNLSGYTGQSSLPHILTSLS